MKMIIAGSLLLVSFSSFAEERNEICREIKLKVDKSIPVPEGVNYFIRPSGQREVGFATDSGNRIQNVDTGKFTAVPGEIDPVPSPDGEILAIPTEVQANANSKMEFYRRSTKSPSGYERIYVDPQVNGNYQSLGVVRYGEQETKYRLLFEGKDSIKVRDYILSKKTGRFEEASGLRDACTNLPKGPSLPMMNKSGTEFSVFFYQEGLTRIYSLSPSGGACELKEEFKATLGKIDFSPDGKKLAFHFDSEAQTADQIYKNPGASMALGVHIYDRVTKTIVPLDVRGDQNSYYPVFLSDDELAFVTEGKNNGKRNFAINVARLSPSDEMGCSTCATDEIVRKRAEFIGTLYRMYCSGVRHSTENRGKLLFTFAKLSPSRCKSLISSIPGEMYSDLRENASLWGNKGIKNVSAEDLSKTCDALGAPRSNPDARTGKPIELNR